jgi:hypothetical protein
VSEFVLIHTKQAKEQDEHTACLFINARNNLLYSVFMRADAVLGIVWNRSSTPSRLVQSCIHNCIDGANPLLLRHGKILDWVKFEDSGVELQPRRLCDIVEVRSATL